MLHTNSLVEPKTPPPRSLRKNAATRILMMGDVRRGRPPKVPHAEVVMPEASGAVAHDNKFFFLTKNRQGMGRMCALSVDSLPCHARSGN